MQEVAIIHDGSTRPLHKWIRSSKELYEKFQVNVTHKLLID